MYSRVTLLRSLHSLRSRSSLHPIPHFSIHIHTHTHAAHTHTTSDHQVGVWHSIFLDEALIRRFKSCRVIVRMGVGYDNVDIAAAARMGIAVCNIPDYGKEGRKKGRKRGYRE